MPKSHKLLDHPLVTYLVIGTFSLIAAYLLSMISGNAAKALTSDPILGFTFELGGAIAGFVSVFVISLFGFPRLHKLSRTESRSNDDAEEVSRKIIDSEEGRWERDLSNADTIFSGIVTLDMTKVNNDGTTREVDEILDSRIANNPEAATNLGKLFVKACDDTTGSQADIENKKLAREFLACYFVTSGASTVRALLLESNFRQQLVKSADEDNNVYVRTQLVRALANTIEKSDTEACRKFVEDFIGKDNVLVSGYAYVFSRECGEVVMKDLQSEWEKTYPGRKQCSFYAYLADDNKRLRYVATGLAGYVNDETSLELLRNNTRHRYDQVRICARSALARRAFTDAARGE